MGSAYSQDLRDRVLGCYDRGMSTKQIADVLIVSPAWARRVRQQRRETGQTSARPPGGVIPRQSIASAINLIVFIERVAGTLGRRVSSIVEVTGFGAQVQSAARADEHQQLTGGARYAHVSMTD